MSKAREQWYGVPSEPPAYIPSLGGKQNFPGWPWVDLVNLACERGRRWTELEVLGAEMLTVSLNFEGSLYILPTNAQKVYAMRVNGLPIGGTAEGNAIALAMKLLLYRLLKYICDMSSSEAKMSAIAARMPCAC